MAFWEGIFIQNVTRETSKELVNLDFFLKDFWLILSLFSF